MLVLTWVLTTKGLGMVVLTVKSSNWQLVIGSLAVGKSGENPQCRAGTAEEAMTKASATANLLNR
jgi:hypothetical protein